MKRFVVLAIGFLLVSPLYAEEKHQTVEGYIQQWKDVAIQQMQVYRIPASITLAQGILESGFGNSTLATKANNHFGIKCHNWSGKTYRQDDDRKNECFRRYNSAMESFADHSLFLTSRSRYNFLFEYKITDYKKWAKGLKTAGYATNPRYAHILINLIEKYKLYRFDESASKKDLIVKNQVVSKNKMSKEHQVFMNENRTKYIIVGNHDTFYQIAEEFELNLNQLYRWNDFPPQKDLLTAGDKVYIMRKRKNIPKKLQNIDSKTITPLWKLAQKYGVQLEALEKHYGYNIPNTVAMNGRN